MNNHSARGKVKGNGRRSLGKKKDGGHQPEPSARSTGSRPAAPAPQGKRARILDAAVKVFAREGFYNAKVSQVAELAGVADGTIYLYFKSKDDLLINLFEDRMELVNRNLRAAVEGETTAKARLRRIIKLHLELVEQNRDMAEVVSLELRQSSKFIREYANPKFGEFLRTIAGAVVEGQRAGELNVSIDPHLCARALFGALDEIALAWLVKPGKGIDLGRAAVQLSDLFIDGLAAP